MNGHSRENKGTQHGSKLLGKPADPNKWQALLAGTIFAITLPLLIAIAIGTFEKPVPARWSVEAATLGLDPMDLARGATTYAMGCAVCHGSHGEGVVNIGKPLRNSAFVRGQSDSQLHDLIVRGRAPSDPLNTTGALMPPRGAVGLSDAQVSDVVAYLRAIQEPGVPVVAMDAWDLRDETGSLPVATGVELADHRGYDLYMASCAACHGTGAQGLDGLGLPLSTSGFVRGASDRDLVTFVKLGRPTWDENNVTGLDMPPKGGNPSITDEQLGQIVGYLREVQKRAMGG